MKIGLAILAVMVIFIVLLGSGGSHTQTEPTAVERAVSRMQDDIKASNEKGQIDKLLESPRIQKRTDKICKKHPEWGDEACLKLAKGKTWVGMDVDMLHESMGLPSSVHEDDLGYQKSYQLAYESESGDSYFYLDEHGTVTAIQTSR